jgi:histone acetyltransferase MYST1
MDEHQIREHEEVGSPAARARTKCQQPCSQVTKMKNVNRIQLGRHIADTWFFSPIPKEYCNADGSPIDILYFCEFSLNFFMHESELARHYKRAAIRHPPGDEIYRDTDARLSMFEVDGSKAVVYCQNLSYYAKFFLDHKTLQWDTQPFLFYVMCEFDEYGCVRTGVRAGGDSH